MSQADELLKGLTDEEMQAYSVSSEGEPHIVISEDRFITVPTELRRIAVQHDHNIETVTFDCPRYWDGIDMSNMQVYINYMRSDGKVGSYIVNRVDSTDESVMHFDWVISDHVTYCKGSLSFLVCIKKTDKEGNLSNHWNSELNQEMYISEGLETEETILEAYPDIITDLLSRMVDVEKNAVQAAIKQVIDSSYEITLDGGNAMDVVEVITVDSELSDTSKNPVENQAVTKRFDELSTSIDEKVAERTSVTDGHNTRITALETDIADTVKPSIGIANDKIDEEITTRKAITDDHEKRITELVESKINVTALEGLVDYIIYEGSLTAEDANRTAWYCEETKNGNVKMTASVVLDGVQKTQQVLVDHFRFPEKYVGKLQNVMNFGNIIISSAEAYNSADNLLRNIKLYSNRDSSDETKITGVTVVTHSSSNIDLSKHRMLANVLVMGKRKEG